MNSAKHLDKLDQRLLALWAADCAEHVLPLFEENHPQDDRPRKAIEAGRAWARGEIACGAARAATVAAHAAARDADEGAARAVARAPVTPPAPPTWPVTLVTPPLTLSRPLPLPRNVIGSTGAYRSTFGLWRFPSEAGAPLPRSDCKRLNEPTSRFSTATGRVGPSANWLTTRHEVGEPRHTT